ncbi:hypothetical protein [Nostoc sp.]
MTSITRTITINVQAGNNDQSGISHNYCDRIHQNLYPEYISDFFDG